MKLTKLLTALLLAFGLVVTGCEDEGYDDDAIEDAEVYEDADMDAGVIDEE